MKVHDAVNMLVCLYEYNLILQSQDLDNNERKILSSDFIKGNRGEMKLGNKLEVIMIIDEL